MSNMSLSMKTLAFLSETYNSHLLWQKKMSEHKCNSVEIKLVEISSLNHSGKSIHHIL
jgi:hypothetical protein